MIFLCGWSLAAAILAASDTVICHMCNGILMWAVTGSSHTSHVGHCHLHYKIWMGEK